MEGREKRVCLSFCNCFDFCYFALLLFCPRLFPLISSPSEMGTSLLFAQGKHLSQLPISFTQHPPSPAHTCSLPFGFMSYPPASPDSLHIISTLLPKPLPLFFLCERFSCLLHPEASTKIRVFLLRGGCS